METPSSRQQTEKVPHTGSLTPDVRETPYKEFDKTSLPQAVEQDLISIPDSAETITAETSIATAPNKKSKRGLMIGIGAGAAGIALAAGAVFGINALNQPPKTGPVPTAEPNGETPSTNEPAPTVDPEVTAKDELIEKRETRAAELGAMNWAEFRGVASRDDALLNLSVVLEKDPDEVYQKNGDLYLANYNPLEVASLDNDGQSIMQQYWFLTQTVVSQRVGDGSTTTLDHDEANKAMSGVWYYTNGELLVSNDYKDMYNYAEGLTDVVMLTDRYNAVETSELGHGTDSDGDEVDYKDVTFETNLGKTEVARFIYSPYVNTSGEEEGIWQLVARVAPEDTDKLDSYM